MTIDADDSLNEVRTFGPEAQRAAETLGHFGALLKGQAVVEAATRDAAPMVEAMRRMMDTSGVFEAFALRQQAVDAAAAVLDSPLTRATDAAAAMIESPMGEFAEWFMTDLRARIDVKAITEALNVAARASTMTAVYDRLADIDPELDEFVSAAQPEHDESPAADPGPGVSTYDKLVLLGMVVGMIIQGLAMHATDRQHAELLEELAELRETVIELVVRLHHDDE